MRNHVSTALALVLTATMAQPNVVTIQAQRDNTMFIEGPESNGAGDYLHIGTNGQGELRRALIRFDVAAAIPPGSTINSVQLGLYMSNSLAGFVDIELHPLLASFGEGTSNASMGEGGGAPAAVNDATWINRFHPGTPWSTPGGDFVASASATLQIVGVGFYTWSSTPALVADVQSWSSSPAGNHGWVLMTPDEFSVPTAKRFNSRTHPSGTTRPKLIVDYTPPVAPAGFCYGDGSGTACPCANAGSAGNGCANSVDANGAHLAASGVASLGADTLVLSGSSMPDSSALYFQGTTQVLGGTGAPFGDGLRCAGGTVVRLGIETNVGGTSQHPSGNDLPVSVRGAVTAPGTVRHYQCWYRNAAAYCTTATFNLTNGVTVTWGG